MTDQVQLQHENNAYADQLKEKRNSKHYRYFGNGRNSVSIGIKQASIWFHLQIGPFSGKNQSVYALRDSSINCCFCGQMFGELMPFQLIWRQNQAFIKLGDNDAVYF